MRIIVTGSAGFIGFHLCSLLLENSSNKVYGLDNLNSYYDVSLKKRRLDILQKKENFSFIKADLEDEKKINDYFANHKIDAIVNLAAQAGVRHSLDHPEDYVSSNIIGFLNILNLAKEKNIQHLIYASTSSVYGMNEKMPFSEDDGADHPLQFYAATKRANELMAHSYSSLYSLPTTGLRFFTVYGPWGRPDMALFKFADGIIHDKEIQLYNNGNHTRDFTYVQDIVESIKRLLDKPPTASENVVLSPSISKAPSRVLNIGNGKQVELREYLKCLEVELGKKAKIKNMPMQKGDVKDTLADTAKLVAITGYTPKYDVEEGVKNFVRWYLEYYKY